MYIYMIRNKKKKKIINITHYQIILRKYGPAGEPKQNKKTGNNREKKRN